MTRWLNAVTLAKNDDNRIQVSNCDIVWYYNQICDSLYTDDVTDNIIFPVIKDKFTPST